MTARLRLEPIGPEHAADLWRLHQDEAVAAWHGGPWSVEDAHGYAAAMARQWAADGVGKWIAYDLGTGELVGRGGLSRLSADAEVTRQIALARPGGRWARHRLELGWTVRSALWGQGYATELGLAGLAFAFGELGAVEVVAFTERHNRRSRAVMERLGMRFVTEFPARGLIEGRPGIHDSAPFALYTATGAAATGTPGWAAWSARPPRAARPRGSGGRPGPAAGC
jgi:RimJ/RimL family protein N-acetyltransferase